MSSLAELNLIWSCLLFLQLYLLPKFSRVPFTIILIPLLVLLWFMALLIFDKRYKDDLRVIFDQQQKLNLSRFGCAKQSKNLKRYLMFTFCILVIVRVFRRVCNRSGFLIIGLRFRIILFFGGGFAFQYQIQGYLMIIRLDLYLQSSALVVFERQSLKHSIL